MTSHLQSDSADTWLANLPPTPRQRRIALAFAAVLLAGLGLTALFANEPLARIDAFIPTVEGIIFLTDLFTATLLFSLSGIHHSRAILILASGYLFTALIVVPHALTFPGAFSPTGLLGPGRQSTGWLYIFWHLGFPTAVLIYAYLRGEELKTSATQPLIRYGIGLSVVSVVVVVVGLTLLANAGERLLPPVFLDATHIAPLGHYIVAFEASICAAVLVIFWRRRRSVLDQWLMVVALAFLSELVINGLFISSRFTLGWYGSRIFSLVTSTIVLVVLLEETTRLYGDLARSNVMLQREQNNRLMNFEAVAASISHEVKQPLTGIAVGGSAVLRFLRTTPPALDKARSTVEAMMAATNRASQMLDDIRNLFGQNESTRCPIDVNTLALSALRSLDRELKTHNVRTSVKLKAGLPRVIGHGGQLQEVIVNLIQNAIDAMAVADNEHRLLQVRTEVTGADEISLEIEDTGPGVDPRKSNEIFDAFFTTKPQGMGLGLAICRMIIGRHEGRLSVSPAHPNGAVFRVILPRAWLTD